MGNTLLLADDSVTMQKVVGITFANEDIDLVTVDNGDAALERAREIRPDVVLADVGMPGLNGYELCSALKSEPELAHVRVILLTGTFDTYDEARAREVGADAHVSKPFEAQALVDQVRSLLAAPARKPAGQAATPARRSLDDEPKTATNVSAPPMRSRAPSPPPVPEPAPLEMSDLDFESLDLDAEAEDLMPEISPELDTHLDDLPAPSATRPVAPTPAPAPVGRPLDPNRTTLVDPREPLGAAPDLMPPDEAELAAGMQTTLLTPQDGADDLFGPVGDFEQADFAEDDLESSGVFGEPEEAERDFSTPRPVSPPRAGVPLTTADDGPEPWDLDAPDLGEMELEPATDELGEASFEEPEPAFGADLGAESGSTEPQLGDSLAEPLDVAEPLEVDEPEDLELMPGEELPWNDAAEGAEPATPSFMDADEAMPAPSWGADEAALEVDPLEAEEAFPPAQPAPAGRPSPVPPAAFEQPTPRAPEPVRPSAPPRVADAATPARATAREREPVREPAAAVVRSQPAEVPIDPAAIRQALEKVAWEAFGPLSEQIVREVVRKVEEIAWETLPQIAERLVQEELARLREADDDER